MPGKMARSAPRPPFGLAAVPVTVGTSRLSCGKAVKREYSRQFGSHPGIPVERRAGPLRGGHRCRELWYA
jgi:hypothetical protein